MNRAFDYQLGPPVGYRACLGLIVLQSDETLEYELRQMLPASGVGLYTTRIKSAPSVSHDTLAAMRGELPAAASLLPTALEYACVGYGCTSGTSVIGAKQVNQIITENCAAQAVTEPVSALLAACERLGVSRLAFLSPYVEDVSFALRRTIAGAGITTDIFGSFNEASETKVAHIDRHSIIAAAQALYDSKKCDAIFISCTNLQTLDVICEIEQTCGCPVLSSNLVLGWHMMLHAALLPAPHIGGQLFCA